MNKNSTWLVFIYVIVGVIIIFSLLYSFDFSFDSFSGSKTSTTTSSKTNPNSHEIALGQSKTVRGIVYGFTKVLTDTRCVPNDDCPKEGFAEVELQVGGLGSSEAVRVNTNSETTYANLNISIDSLTPIPANKSNTATLFLNIKEVN